MAAIILKNLIKAPVVNESRLPVNKSDNAPKLNLFKCGVINSVVLSKFEAILNIFWSVNHYNIRGGPLEIPGRGGGVRKKNSCKQTAKYK
jgi:hypothetical protein